MEHQLLIEGENVANIDFPRNVLYSGGYLICRFDDYKEWFSLAEQLHFLGLDTLAERLRLSARKSIIRRIEERLCRPVSPENSARFQRCADLAIRGTLPDYHLAELQKL